MPPGPPSYSRASPQGRTQGQDGLGEGTLSFPGTPQRLSPRAMPRPSLQAPTPAQRPQPGWDHLEQKDRTRPGTCEEPLRALSALVGRGRSLGAHSLGALHSSLPQLPGPQTHPVHHPPSPPKPFPPPRKPSSTVSQQTHSHSTFKRHSGGASLVAQWLRICLLMQGTRVRALVWEDPTCRGATRPMSHNY